MNYKTHKINIYFTDCWTKFGLEHGFWSIRTLTKTSRSSFSTWQIARKSQHLAKKVKIVLADGEINTQKNEDRRFQNCG